MDKAFLIEELKLKGILNDRLIEEALKEVPREEFVLPEYKNEAYLDTALPILCDQTISQPTTIVLMLEALELKPGLKVLEIGGGSGYQAALIGKAVGEKGEVHSIEFHEELVGYAKRIIKRLDIKNVHIIRHDGSKGYEKEAPYDRIIVACACPPEQIKIYSDQLKDGGILVIPVGPSYMNDMLKIRKRGNDLKMQELGKFAFVPLQSE